MTYFGILFVFVVIPIILFGALNYWHDKRQKHIPENLRLLPPLTMILILVGIAVIYTTPWDNYLVATSVWWYDLNLVTGIVIGWVPIEEYSFFVLQSLMTGLWVMLLMRYLRTETPFVPRPGIRKGAVAFFGIIWLGSLIILLVGWKPGNYLGLELVWALLPILLQMAFGADILWHHRKLVGVAILTSTLYLCGVDFMGIAGGTWTINPELTTGIVFFDVLPLEEALFFLLTNILLVGGLVLGLSAETRKRLPQVVLHLIDRQAA